MDAVKGLSLIPSVIGRFDSSNGLRVPHIGWNRVQLTKESGILHDIEGQHIYFVHSYRALPSDANKDWVSSTCNYGDTFIASISRGNVHAVQFHPEKSEGDDILACHSWNHLRKNDAIDKEKDDDFRTSLCIYQGCFWPEVLLHRCSYFTFKQPRCYS
ncbi:hypothetical protein M5K25_028174 [Dendrobium thyrsiflorum]|uniref:Glutamine amidotransferase domain-containing protein n=1 Tax=Dendrobium thyrsiflorum TaxID=117978 RepID=A0ABD0TVR5_DENTH